MSKTPEKARWPRARKHELDGRGAMGMAVGAALAALTNGGWVIAAACFVLSVYHIWRVVQLEDDPPAPHPADQKEPTP